jgi:hypothetical protein
MTSLKPVPAVSPEQASTVPLAAASMYSMTVLWTLVLVPPLQADATGFPVELAR